MKARFISGTRVMALAALFTAHIPGFPLKASDAASDSSKPGVKNSLPADADSAWKEVENASKPPPPPAEWGGKPPTREQIEAFNHFLGEKSAEVAAKAREFYTRFPEHPKAESAKQREERFLKQAISLGGAQVAEEVTEVLPEEEKLKLKVNEIHRRALEKHAPEGTEAVSKAVEAGVRELMKEYPNSPLLWDQLLLAAKNSLDKDRQRKILNEIVKSEVAGEEAITRAKAALKVIGATGQPLEIAFTAADGRKVDVQKMKGKVVLVDFWAAWCGPCMASLPEVIRLYNKYHGDGFEIVGINMDKQQRAMEQVVHRFKMQWPQYFDGRGWGTKFALEYDVRAIPAVWLVDKKGILRTMNARQNLEERIKELLAEED